MSEKRIIEGPADSTITPIEPIGTTIFKELKNGDPNEVILNDVKTSEKVTRGKLLELSIKMAVSLKSVGVQKDDTIFVMSENNCKYAVIILGGLYIGAKLSLINHEYKIDEFQHILSLCKPRIIFVSESVFKNVHISEIAELFQGDIALTDNSPIILSPQVKARIRYFDDFVKNVQETHVSAFVPVKVNPKEHVAFILASSGTTGLPKGVLLTHANIRISMLLIKNPNFLAFTSKESTLGCLPFCHTLGLTILLGCIITGCKIFIMEKFRPDKFLETIQKNKISKLLAVPSVLVFLTKSPLVQKYEITSIEDIIYGGAPSNDNLYQTLKEKFNIKFLRQTYGMTEVGFATFTTKNMNKFNSVGKVAQTYQIAVCDPKSEEYLGVNEIGEIRIRGDGVMKGYLSNDDATKEAFDQQGFLKSGDMGYYDEEGYFYIVDRFKELIKYKAFQVSPSEIENLLLRHPAVKEACVIGVPDEAAGEIPLAFVVKQFGKDVTSGELCNFVANRVSKQKWLHGGVKFLDEIPKFATGKINRKHLKKLV